MKLDIYDAYDKLARVYSECIDDAKYALNNYSLNPSLENQAAFELAMSHVDRAQSSLNDWNETNGDG